MPNLVTRSLKFIRDLPGRASPRWPWPLRKVRKAKITDAERDYFERYGESVVAMMVSSGFDGNVEHARDWLTERADSRERREQWTSVRDLFLEMVIIALIGWEIWLGYQEADRQSKNFQKQQQVLTNLEQSSAATTATLQLMNAALEQSLATSKSQLEIIQQEYSRELLKPDIEASLLYPQRLSLTIHNKSKSKAAHGVLYEARFWLLDRVQVDNFTLAGSKVGSIEAVEPDGAFGPFTFEFPSLSTTFNEGERLFGYVMLHCPDCFTRRVYWVYAVVGKEGVYREGKPNEYDFWHIFPTNATAVVESFKQTSGLLPIPTSIR